MAAMAAEDKVKQYLAQWFQLGKKIILKNGNEELLPNPVLRNNNYSPEFEDCWQKIMNSENGDCYLEGSEQTIKELLSPKWSIDSCARCGILVPMLELGLNLSDCLCSDLDNWPNNELPSPRLPIDNQKRISDIRQRVSREKIN